MTTQTELFDPQREAADSQFPKVGEHIRVSVLCTTNCRVLAVFEDGSMQVEPCVSSHTAFWSDHKGGGWVAI